MKDAIIKLAKRLLKLKFYESAICKEDIYDCRNGGIKVNSYSKSIYSKENLIDDKYFHLIKLGTEFDDFNRIESDIEYIDERDALNKLIESLLSYIEKRVDSSNLKIFKISNQYLGIFEFTVLNNKYETKRKEDDILLCKFSVLYESFKLINKMENEYNKKSKKQDMLNIVSMEL